MDKRDVTFQWVQLLVLSAVHFLADMFASMLPAILPPIRDEFSLSLSLGGSVIVIMTLASNSVQVFTGHTRAESSKPLLLHLGLVLGASICLLSVLPRQSGAFGLLVVLATVSGCGVGIAHPEGLRAIHALERIPSSVSTGIFMSGGFVGFAAGGAVSTVLVSRFGLAGLYPLAMLPFGAILLVLLLRIRLAVEPGVNNGNGEIRAGLRLPFWLIMAMTLPAGISTTIIAHLLPTVLNEAGFELTFGGYSMTVYGLGGALGSFVLGAFAHRRGVLGCSIAANLLTVPVLVLYLVFLKTRPAVGLLAGAGFFSFAAYILMVTLARDSAGPNLGRRMGFVVGGNWAFASLVFMALLPVAERVGTRLLLDCSVVGYLVSAFLGLLLLVRIRKSGETGQGAL
ncbi:MAG: MFS transporter [Phycisphaerales bacterium]|nr:MAG: MFS transporter [Phycisphaerales bacterium]